MDREGMREQGFLQTYKIIKNIEQYSAILRVLIQIYQNCSSSLKLCNLRLIQFVCVIFNDSCVCIISSSIELIFASFSILLSFTPQKQSPSSSYFVGEDDPELNSTTYASLIIMLCGAEYLAPVFSLLIITQVLFVV